MARYLLSRNCMFRFTQGFKNSQRLRKYCGCSAVSSPSVIHDRQNQRFTINLDSDACGGHPTSKCDVRNNSDVFIDKVFQGKSGLIYKTSGAVSSAVLKYTIRHDRQVDLMSTEVPESHRGKGVAALLAKAALDFVVEENLKARISCWYIRKYVDENPHLRYQAHIEDE